jgi:hypothetical protein
LWIGLPCLRIGFSGGLLRTRQLTTKGEEFRDNLSYYKLLTKFSHLWLEFHRLCGLVVRDFGYRTRGSSLIPGATRFF